MSTLLPIEEKRLRKILEKSPHDLEAHFRLGALLEEEERWAEAIPEFESVLAGNPGDNRAYRHLKEAGYRQHRRDQGAGQRFISFKTSLNGRFCIDEHSWITLESGDSLTMLPVAFSYRDISERLSGASLLEAIERCVNDGNRPLTSLSFIREEELYESASTLNLQLGHSLFQQREGLEASCRKLLASIESESLVTMPLLEITRCDDIPAERFRLCWGFRLICQGGMKKDCLFAPSDLVSMKTDKSVFFDEMLQKHGRWLGSDGMKPDAPDSLDSAGYLSEALRPALSRNLYLFWKMEKTVRLLDSLRRSHQSIPWAILEAAMSLMSMHNLIRYYIFSGGSISTVIELFEDLADNPGRVSHHYARCALVDERLYRKSDIYELIYGGSVMAFSAPPGLEDRILLCLSTPGDTKSTMGPSLLGELLSYVEAASARIEGKGKVPLLICHRYIRPLIREFGAYRDEPLMLTLDEVPSMVSMPVFDEAPLQESSHNGAGAEQRALCEDRVLELLKNGAEGRSFAYMTDRGRAMLLSLDGAHSTESGSIVSPVLNAQERGFSLSGACRCLSSRDCQAPLEARIGRRSVLLSLGRGLFDRNEEGRALQGDCSELLKSFQIDYGIPVPEVKIELRESLEPFSYQISYDGSLVISRSSLPPEPGPERSDAGESDGREMAGTLRNFILSHIKELISYETVTQYCGAGSPSDGGPIAQTSPELNVALKSILGSLLEESIPCNDRALITSHTSRLLKSGCEPLYIAETLRKELRKTICLLHSSDRGVIHAVFLSADFEVILASEFAASQLVETVPGKSRERDYIAQLIVKEYFHTQGSIAMRPLVCSSSIRKMLWRLIHPIVPELSVLSRDEIAGWPVHSEGEVSAPQGFRSFIVDETLKSGILDDYDSIERKAAVKLTGQISLCPADEKEAGKKASSPEALTFNVSVGMRIAGIIDIGDGSGQFFTGLLFVREWMKRSLKRDIPRIVISTDSEMPADELRVQCRELIDIRMKLPEGTAFEYYAPASLDEVQAGNTESPSHPMPFSGLPSRRLEGDRTRLGAGEAVLLKLCTVLLNNSRHYQAEAPLRKTMEETARRCGIDDWESLMKDLTLLNLHPLLIVDFLSRKGHSARLLSRRALVREARREVATPFDCSRLADFRRRIRAVCAGESVEDFLGCYFLEFNREMLLSAPPPSVKAVRARLVDAVKTMMEKGFPPVIVTERLEPENLAELLCGAVPHIAVMKRDEMPADITVEAIERVEMSDGDFYRRTDSAPYSSLSGLLSFRDFYTLCGLFCDYEGDSLQGAACYDRLLSFATDHPDGLSRAALCHQRNGDRRKAGVLRRRGRKLWKPISLSMPAYYCIDITQAGRESGMLRKLDRNPQNLFRLAFCEYQEGEPQRAESSLREAIDDLPFDDEAFVLMGHILSESERCDEALAWYRKALALNPYSDEAVTAIASILSERTEGPAPWKIHMKSYENAPYDDDRLHSLGMACADQDDYLSMSRCAEEIVRRDRDSGQAHFMHSRALHSMGLRDEELESLREALLCKPHSVLYNRTAGNSLWSSGRYEEAVDRYIAALGGPDGRKDEDAEPYEYLHRAKIFIKFGEYGQAARILAEGLNRHDRHPALLHLTGEVALSGGDFDKAKTSFEAAFTINPQNARYSLSLAEALLLEGDRERSAGICEAVRKSFPSWPVPYLRLAGFAAERQRYGEAAAFLRKGISEAPHHLDLYMLLFSVLRKPSRLIEWQKRISERSFLAPDSAVYHFCMSLIATLQGDRRRGRDEMERAYLIAPESPRIVEFLARYMLMDGEIEKSLVILRVAQKRILRSSPLFFLEGAAWMYLGNTARAKESFMRSSACAPLFPYARTSKGYAALLENRHADAEAEARKALTFSSVFAPALRLLAEAGKAVEDGGELRSSSDAPPGPEGWGLERGRG
jgi:flagellar biosynthesis component FlhA/Flp pilus assembly protein TadD